MRALSKSSKTTAILTAYQKRTLTAQGAGPNKRTPLSYQDTYFGDGGADVDFRVQNIVQQARRNGSLIYLVVWKQLGGGHDKIEDTWQSLGNIPLMDSCILENFLAKHQKEQAVLKAAAEDAREVRVATAQTETNAARTRMALPGVGGQSPVLRGGSQRHSRSRASSSSAGATAVDETGSGDKDNAEGNQSQATFPLVWRCLFQTHPLSALFQVY